MRVRWVRSTLDGIRPEGYPHCGEERFESRAEGSSDLDMNSVVPQEGLGSDASALVRQSSTVSYRDRVEELREQRGDGAEGEGERKRMEHLMGGGGSGMGGVGGNPMDLTFETQPFDIHI